MATGPNIVAGGLQTYETPIAKFVGDIVIGPSQDVLINPVDQLLDNCTGFLLCAVVGSVVMSINGGGDRVVPTSMIVNNADIKALRVRTGIGSTVTIQLHGV